MQGLARAFWACDSCYLINQMSLVLFNYVWWREQEQRHLRLDDQVIVIFRNPEGTAGTIRVITVGQLPAKGEIFDLQQID
jgi:hypothetical protein